MVLFLKQPKTLERMALKKLVEWIVSHTEKLAPAMAAPEPTYPNQALQLLSRQIEIIRNHVQSRLPRRFYDEAMSKLIRTLTVKFYQALIAADSSIFIVHAIIRRMIETLFTKKLTTITSIKSNDWMIFEGSFYSKSHLIPGLTSLNLRGVCTDGVLRHVVKNFKLIETFDVSYSKINDDSIDIMIRLSHLKTVDVSSTEVTEKGVEMLLTCPNIEYIKCDVEMENVLERIVQRKDHGRRYNLKIYRTWGTESFQERTLVVKMCPSIEKVIFDMHTGISRNVKNDLNAIRDMHSLRELEMYGFKFYSYQVKELLQVRGNNIVFLRLHDTSEIDVSALKHICISCPNLQDLDLYICEDKDIEEVIENKEISCKGEIPPLKHLKKISVTGTLQKTYLSCKEQHLIFLLSICPNIEYIEISEVVILDGDNFLLEVLEKNPTKLKYLRKFHFFVENLNLSKAVIDQVAQNCVYGPVISRGYN